MPSQLDDERVEFCCKAQVAGEGPDRRRNMPVRRRRSESSVDRNEVRVNIYDPCMRRSLMAEKCVYNYSRRFALMFLLGILDK